VDREPAGCYWNRPGNCAMRPCDKTSASMNMCCSPCRSRKSTVRNCLSADPAVVKVLGSIFWSAAAEGLTVTAIEQDITAKILDDGETEILYAAQHSLALAMVRRYFSGDRFIEVAEAMCPADRSPTTSVSTARSCPFGTIVILTCRPSMMKGAA
jgi:hypothetical protein